jgi:hypothetical protein
MVLICNNNVLTIDQFHKHRCEEKNSVRTILANRKHLGEQYKEEEPEVVRIPTRSFSESIATMDYSPPRVIMLNGVNRR